jgi:hypothetical protein
MLLVLVSSVHCRTPPGHGIRFQPFSVACRINHAAP